MESLGITLRIERPLLATALVLGMLLPAVASDDLASVELLTTKHGLVRLADKIWLLPPELELKDRLAELPKRRERIVAAEKDLDASIEQNLRAWQETRPQIVSLKSAMAKLSPSDPQRVVIQRQLDTLEATAADPKRVGVRGDVRTQVVHLASERCELLADVTWIRSTVSSLKENYASLATDAEVAQALRRIGQDQRLGPQRNYQADVQRLGDYERLAATRWTPIFLQGNITRVTALVNETAVATFSWSDSLPQAVVLTASTAEAIDLEVPPDAPRETISLPGQRKVSTRRMSLGYLRLGQCNLQGVTAHILPPEAEDLGNWLSRSALREHEVRLEPERLRMWIDP